MAWDKKNAHGLPLAASTWDWMTGWLISCIILWRIMGGWMLLLHYILHNSFSVVAVFSEVSMKDKQQANSQGLVVIVLSCVISSTQLDSLSPHSTTRRVNNKSTLYYISSSVAKQDSTNQQLNAYTHKYEYSSVVVYWLAGMREWSRLTIFSHCGAEGQTNEYFW